MNPCLCSHTVIPEAQRRILARLAQFGDEMKQTWDGLSVGPDHFSPKHPQLDPKPKPNDPEAIRNPRPETSVDNTSFVLYTNVDKGILGTKLETYQIAVSLGEVTITTS